MKERPFISGTSLYLFAEVVYSFLYELIEKNLLKKTLVSVHQINKENLFDIPKVLFSN
jgi:hypothetical protein